MFYIICRNILYKYLMKFFDLVEVNGIKFGVNRDILS